MSKVKVTGNENIKICFLLISLSKVNRFASSQDQNDQRPILRIVLNTFHQQKCLILLCLCVIIRESRMSPGRVLLAVLGKIHLNSN